MRTQTQPPLQPSYTNFSQQGGIPGFVACLWVAHDNRNGFGVKKTMRVTDKLFPIERQSHYFGANEPIMVYFQLPYFMIKFQKIIEETYIWKCRLQNGKNIVLASVS